jgi:putative SOS response-associated peptidase YedK
VGIRRLSTGDRKCETDGHQLFAFLTTAAKDAARQMHTEAMPVLATTANDWDAWLTGSVDEATALQKPLTNDALRVAVTAGKIDRAPVDE